MKDILLPVSESPECALALEQGFVLGEKLKANVIGCHIRPHSDSDAILEHSIAKALIKADEYDLAWESMLKKNNKSNLHTNAAAFFKATANKYKYDLLKKPGNTRCAMWIEKVGSPNKVFSIIGPVTDLIVVSRPLNKNDKVAKTIMNGAILNTSTPVLILPQKKTAIIGRKISIAWNQSNEASTAVKAALPLLTLADEVSIITCGPEGRTGPKSKHLINYLEHWGINCKHLPINNMSCERTAILNGYQETQSDLLIMGGYSRSKLRERIFGGMTEYMLNDACIPIFMVHK